MLAPLTKLKAKDKLRLMPFTSSESMYSLPSSYTLGTLRPRLHLYELHGLISIVRIYLDKLLGPYRR
jgi:hypothetical protein